MEKAFFTHSQLVLILDQLRNGTDEERVRCLTAVSDMLAFNVDPSSFSRFRKELEDAYIMDWLGLFVSVDVTDETNVRIAILVNSILARVSALEMCVRWNRIEHAFEKIGQKANICRLILSVLLNNPGLPHSLLREYMISRIKETNDRSLRRCCQKLGQLGLIKIEVHPKTETCYKTSIFYSITWLGEGVLTRLEKSGA